MQFRPASLILAAGLAIAAPATLAADEPLPPLDRETLGQEIRAWLLENPEIIEEMVARLQARDMERQQAEDTRLLEGVGMERLVGDAPVLGDPDAALTMVIFTDYLCGHCRAMHPDVLTLLEANPDLRVVVREFPVLGANSMLLASLALAAREVGGDEVYARVKDAFYALGQEVTSEGLAEILVDVGLDPEEINALIGSVRISGQIAEAREIGRDLRIEGTPGIVFDGMILRGRLPAASLQNAVDMARTAREG